jgi:hypothetical protein
LTLTVPGVLLLLSASLKTLICTVFSVVFDYYEVTSPYHSDRSDITGIFA